MVDITHKRESLRKAVALAEIRVSMPVTMAAVRERTVPKGDVLECARVAALFAVKNTASAIPDCHPLPVEYTAVRHELGEDVIRLTVEVHTIYKTGVEVEAMHGAAVAAVTVYDMLKPIDKGVEIGSIRLLSKEGGKSGHTAGADASLRCAVVVCSDSAAAGRTEDRSGALLLQRLRRHGIEAEGPRIIPDDEQAIRQAVGSLAEAGYALVLLTGGTGASPRDNTPEAVSALIDRPIPGIMEAARHYSMQRTPLAMLSRGVAGFVGETLVMTFPGSPSAIEDYMEALFPHVLHLFLVRTGSRH